MKYYFLTIVEIDIKARSKKYIQHRIPIPKHILLKRLLPFRAVLTIPQL